MEQQEIRESVTSIGLEHMRLEIDLGEVVTKDGPEAAQNAAIWVVQQFFWNHPSNPRGQTRKEMLLSTLDQAKYMALNYLLNEWEILGNRASIFVLNDAQLTGWHTNKELMFDTLDDMLSSMLEQQDTATGTSTYGFIVKELLPAAQRYGVEPALLFSASTQARKLKELVFTARKILKDETMPDLDKEKKLKYFIEKAADKTVTHAVFKGETDAFRNKQQKQIQRLEGHESIMPNGETWIVVRCPAPIDERIIEMLLQAKVDLRITDWRDLTIEMAQMLKGIDEVVTRDDLINVLEGRKNGRKEAILARNTQAVL